MQKKFRSNYKHIDNKIRMQIIERVVNNGQSLKFVASSTKINISTCKAIVKVFKEEGRVGKKQKRDKKMKVIESFSFFTFQKGDFKLFDEIKLEQSRISFAKQENINQRLQEQAKRKAESMINVLIEDQNKKVLEIRQIQQKQINNMQNNYQQYLMPFSSFINHNFIVPRQCFPFQPLYAPLEFQNF